MKKPYKLKKRNDRGGQYAIIDKATGKCKFTGTTDKHQAEEQARIKYGLSGDTNQHHHMKAAEYHLTHCNPEWNTNTWDIIAKRMISAPRQRIGGEKSAQTKRGLTSAWNNACWNNLRDKRAIDTVANDFQKALKNMGNGAIEFGRKLHNFAINHRLIPYAIIGTEMWPKIATGIRSRAITGTEHIRIVQYICDPTLWAYRQLRGKNKGTTCRMWRDEWVNWLWFLWYTGASSADAANMKAENIKWDEGVLEYVRGKWQEPEKHVPVRVAIAKGGEFDKLLKRLPETDNLFPLLSQTRQDTRAKRFREVIDHLGIPPVSSHGYRRSFAERAKEAGMSVEDRMTNLGHACYEMAHHYSKNAKVVPASIEVLDRRLEAA